MGRAIFMASMILLAVVVHGVDSTPTPIFWRWNSTPTHASTTIVSRPHHHYHGVRPGQPQPAAVAQHNYWQGPGHVHPGSGAGPGHHHSRPRPPLVGAHHHGTVRHTHFRQIRG